MGTVAERLGGVECVLCVGGVCVLVSSVKHESFGDRECSRKAQSHRLSLHLMNLTDYEGFIKWFY